MKMFAVGAAVAALCFGSAASAADMPTKAVKAPIVSVFSWTGFYVGLDAGYSWDKTGLNVPAGAGGTASATINSFTGGGHIGYLYQFNNALVIGAEGDMSWLGGDSSTGAFPGTPAQGVSANAKWEASLRGVLGYALDRTLVYATGGASWLNSNGCGIIMATGSCIPNTSYSQTQNGWIVGGGAAYAITKNIIGRVEYLHADYGTFSYTASGITGGVANVTQRTDKVRAGVSWKF